MNVNKVKQELAAKYPGVVIKENQNEAGEVTEIIGEIDRNLIGSERDVAVAVIDASPEHYHKKTTEEYEVLIGSLTVFLDGQPYGMEEGQKLVVKPGVRHRAEGDETWLYCYSVPAWSAEDYFEVR